MQFVTWMIHWILAQSNSRNLLEAGKRKGLFPELTQSNFIFYSPFFSFFSREKWVTSKNWGKNFAIKRRIWDNLNPHFENLDPHLQCINQFYFKHLHLYYVWIWNKWLLTIFWFLNKKKYLLLYLASKDWSENCTIQRRIWDWLINYILNIILRPIWCMRFKINGCTHQQYLVVL